MASLSKVTHNKFIERFVSVLKYNPVSVCPICKANISPVEISIIAYDGKPSSNMACVLNFCTGCKSPFLSIYKISPDGNGNATELQHIRSEPNRFAEQLFDEKITNLSPQFVKIYNQALAAEAMELDEIAGLGYRKAMEFLIKDFAIHKYPDHSDNIKRMPLAQCIRNYISSDEIKTLAERCAWIGNDEAHYVRKQEDRDVSDMKSFIQAMVYFIGMILITEDAASMIPIR